MLENVNEKTQDVSDYLKIIRKMEENRWAKFEKLGLLLLDNPHKSLSQGMYWNDILSVFLPSLKTLEHHKNKNLFNSKPITSKNFPIRKRILKEIHSYFMTVQDFAVIQKIAENSETLIKYLNWPAMDIYQSALSVTRRYYFMVQVLTDKEFFISSVSALQNMFTENIQLTKMQEKFTNEMVRDMFQVDHVYDATNTDFYVTKDGKPVYVSLASNY